MNDEWDLLWRLGLALLLSSAIGVERELRQKSAGLRTHTLVGVGSALFLLVSAYGFSDVLAEGTVVLDPSRVAAQVVSGIGFIGGGLIFVQRTSVRGLTTAAGVWVTAAVGMAAGAGLAILAVATTLAYFAVAYAYPWMIRFLPRSRFAPLALHLTYMDGKGVLRDVLSLCTGSGFSVADVEVEHRKDAGGGPGTVAVELELRGTGSLTDLASELDALDGVLAVSAEDADLDAA